jgi:6-phosphogluconate dehydrogenase
MYDRNDNKMLYYIWYGPGGAYDDDDDTVHNGIGSLQVHPNLVDFFRKIIKIRVSKILDIISEWVDEQVEDEVDEVTIYPERHNPPVY